MKARTIIAMAAVAAVAAGLGWWAAQRGSQTSMDESAMAAQRGAGEGEGGESRVLYYYDPMRPDVHFDAPGKSPFMDMELVPKFAGNERAGEGVVVEVDPRMAQNLGIRTMKVERETMTHGLDVVGSVEVDERLIYAVESRAEGWVERLAVRAVGDPVRKGQLLAGVYSPELFSAQEELALAVRSGDPDLVAASRQRLRLLGLSSSQIEQVQASGKAQRQAQIASPRAGVVTELNVREGQKVMPGMPLMRIADLSRVWITVEVPEALASALSQGGRAEAQLAALPGKVFEGRVDYVYPKLDPVTRTVRARVVFENRSGQLKPGMYANVALPGEVPQEMIMVPSEAVIRTGRRNVVIVAEGEGRFRPVEVTLGPEHEGRIEILDGLVGGQSVVISGQFLIDSEASLRGAYQRLEPPSQEDSMEGGAQEEPPAHDPAAHEGHQP